MEHNDKPHPINLLEIFFTKSNVESIPGFPLDHEKEITEKPINNIFVEKIENDPGKYFTRMTSVLNPEKLDTCPYHIEMECIGFFSADPSLPEDEAKKGITITAHNVLYGAIREAVLWLTGRQPFGTFTYGLSILKPTLKKE